jgi:hypothetical protein
MHGVLGTPIVQLRMVAALAGCTSMNHPVFHVASSLAGSGPSIWPLQLHTLKEPATTTIYQLITSYLGTSWFAGARRGRAAARNRRRAGRGQRYYRLQPAQRQQGREAQPAASREIKAGPGLPQRAFEAEDSPATELSSPRAAAERCARGSRLNLSQLSLAACLRGAAKLRPGGELRRVGAASARPCIRGSPELP